jgi:Domain of unknown function (DUF4440)
MSHAITQEEITRFVQDWFRKLDDHAPPNEFLRMLSDEGLEMRFPDCTIGDFNAFRERYERRTRFFFDERHTAKIGPAKIDGDRASVGLEVAWQATWVEPAGARAKHVTLTAKENWIVRRSDRNGYGLEILFYDATVEPMQYATESSRLPREPHVRSEVRDNFVEAGYHELCASYHAIDTFRGTLLGALPLATGTGVFLLLNKDLATLTGFLRPIGLFGVAITLGLFAYELYGIRKCHALIAAGQEFEGRLNIQGQFATRPRSLLGFINEPFATALIYPAVLAAWVYLALCFSPVQGSPRALWSPGARWGALATFLASAIPVLVYNFCLAQMGKRMKDRSVLLENLSETNQSMLAAEEKGDQAALERYLAKEFVILRVGGKTEDREAYMKALAGNRNRGREASEVRMHLEDDQAVFTCCVTTTRTPAGSPSEGRFWNTRLFEWRDEHWQCTAWQVMKLGKN